VADERDVLTQGGRSCPDCGKSVEEADRYCAGCGRLLGTRDADRAPTEESIPIPARRAAARSTPEVRRLERRTVVCAFGVLLIIAGSASPWIRILGQGVSGTSLGSPAWGMWTLLVGVGVLWTMTARWFWQRAYIVWVSAGLGALVALILVGVLSYYAWSVRLSGLDYGWYLTLAGGVVVGTNSLVDKPRPPLLWVVVGCSFCVVTIGLALAAGHRQCARDKVPRTQAEFYQELYRGLALGSVGLPASKPAPPALSWTINSVWTALELGEGMGRSTAPSGSTYVVLNVTVRNDEQKELAVVPQLFSLEASNKNVYSGAFELVTDDRVSLLIARLLPAGEASGDLVFVMPVGVQPVALRYEGP